MIVQWGGGHIQKSEDPSRDEHPVGVWGLEIDGLGSEMGELGRVRMSRRGMCRASVKEGRGRRSEIEVSDQKLLRGRSGMGGSFQK